MKVELNNKWVKIFVVDNEQVLVKKETSKERFTEYIISISVCRNEIQHLTEISCLKELARDAIFSVIDSKFIEPIARDIINGIK